MSAQLQEGEGPSAEVQEEAKGMGWVPLEQFKGDKDHWIDADEFVERGRAIMPILLANNKRLQKQVSTQTTEIGTLQQNLHSATVAIEKLEKHYTEANRRAVESAKVQLKAQLKEAREDNDVDAELEIQDKLNLLNNIKDTTPTTKPTEKPVSKDPVWDAWVAENPWFDVDKKKTKEIVRIAEDLRDDGTELTGREFFDECVRLYEEKQDPESGRPASKVEGSQPRGGSGRGGKSFADLPADAKRACHEDADDLVGAGKRFKTLKDWETQYAKIYFSE
jgi:hypothetical protein